MADSLKYKFSGDKERGREFVGFAKATLAELYNIMDLGNLNCDSLVKSFDDGTTVRVQTDYGISTVEIFCPITPVAEKLVLPEDEYYMVTSYIAGVHPVMNEGIKLRLYAVGGEEVIVISECIVQDLAISAANDMMTMQVIWDVLNSCYQLFIGDYGGTYPHVRQYAVTLTGEIIETETPPGHEPYEPQYSVLPNQYASIELRETDMTDNQLLYLYYGTNNFALLNTDFRILESEEEVEGSWTQPYFAFMVERWPTYSLPQPPGWNVSILKTVLDDGTMVILHGWISHAWIAEWRIIYEDHKTHEAIEWLIYQQHVDAYGRATSGEPIAFSINNRFLQVENGLWFFETSEYTDGYYNSIGLNDIKRCHLRIANVNNPSEFFVAEEHESSLIGNSVYTHWTYSDDAWSFVTHTVKAPTNVIVPVAMTYCQHEGVVLIVKLKWDNLDAGNYTNGQGGGFEYGEAPEGMLTVLIDTYLNTGEFLHRTILEELAVPSVWSFSVLKDRLFLPIPLAQSEWDNLIRLSRLGYSKVRNSILM